jgi:hypothetical protein
LYNYNGGLEFYQTSDFLWFILFCFTSKNNTIFII